MTDNVGTRQETLIILPGTEATMVMPDGSTQPMTLNVQITEYTVGEIGPDTMPAELPPASGNTYAVEYTSREAVVAGADTATAARLYNARGVAMGADGAVYIAEGRRVRKIDAPWPGFTDETVVASPGGGELFVFRPDGHHDRTLDAVTGATLLSFEHNWQGHLVSITDADNNVTRVHRDAHDSPVSIEAPFGQTTTLETGNFSMLSTITAPDGAQWSMTYHGGSDYGQIATFTTPRNEQSVLTYDEYGRLESDRAPDGSSQTLVHDGRPGTTRSRARPSSVARRCTG